MDATRNLALTLLRGVIERRLPLESCLDQLPASDTRDRAAAHRLAATVLRRLGTRDAVLEPHLRRAPPVPVRLILAMGAAQLLLLDTPAHAAVGTAVGLARAAGFVPHAGLVNAVLRRVAAAGTGALAGLDGPRLDTPPWLWASWGDAARAIAEAHAAEAALDLTLRPGAATPDGGTILPTGSVRLAAGTRITELRGFAEGEFWAQDAAAALPASLLAAQPGETVADLCAAPGGKTAQLAATGARVLAVEREASRLDRLRQNLTRLQLDAEIIHADALTWHPPAKLDAVLLDAPCSATGTMRRHPDVAHLKGPREVSTLAGQQLQLLAAAAAMLRPGGRLLYAVCSLQPEEGPRIAERAAGLGLRAEPFTEAELVGLPEARTEQGYLRTHPGLWPGRGGMDGFFCARFRAG